MMLADQLSTQLRDMHSAAPDRKKVTAIHLFGIRHAADLSEYTTSELKLIAEQAGLSPQYGTELRKMVRLSEYVRER